MLITALLIVGAAAFMAVMLLMIVLSFRPDTLKIFEKIVCRENEKMEILFSKASHHQPGEKSIEIYCNNYGKRRIVNGKTLLLSFLLAFFIMLPFAAIIVTGINKYFIS